MSRKLVVSNRDKTMLVLESQCLLEMKSENGILNIRTFDGDFDQKSRNSIVCDTVRYSLSRLQRV